MNLNELTTNIQNDPINQAFRDGAQLVISSPNSAYVQLGLTRYYFMGDSQTREVETFGGKKIIQTIVPYDGWEKSVGFMGVTMEPEDGQA